MSNKDPKGMPPKENRESAQKKVDRVVKEVGLTKDERNELHEQLGQDYMSYQDIKTIAEGIKKQNE